MVQKVDLLRPETSVDGLSVTIFVVNRRPESQRFRDVSNVFQVGLELKAGDNGFIAGFPEDYADFIASQADTASTITFQSRREVSEDLVEKQREACSRMRNGIELLKTDAAALDAFRVMNLSTRLAGEVSRIAQVVTPTLRSTAIESRGGRHRLQ